jgi:hypothetical protein
VSALTRGVVTPAALEDIRALPERDVQRAVLTALLEIERNLEFGPLLDVRPGTGDLRGARKVYVDKPTDTKPRYRVVYWCAPSERRPRTARVLAVGRRAGLDVYAKSAERYNSDRAAVGQAPIEGLSDKIIGLGD